LILPILNVRFCTVYYTAVRWLRYVLSLPAVTVTPLRSAPRTRCRLPCPLLVVDWLPGFHYVCYVTLHRTLPFGLPFGLRLPATTLFCCYGLLPVVRSRGLPRCPVRSYAVTARVQRCYGLFGGCLPWLLRTFAPRPRLPRLLHAYTHFYTVSGLLQPTLFLHAGCIWFTAVALPVYRVGCVAFATVVLHTLRLFAVPRYTVYGYAYGYVYLRGCYALHLTHVRYLLDYGSTC